MNLSPLSVFIIVFWLFVALLPAYAMIRTYKEIKHQCVTRSWKITAPIIFKPMIAIA